MIKENKKSSKRKIVLSLVTIIAFTIIVFQSCKKEQPDPLNPYSSINYDSYSSTDTIDPKSFVGLHKNIFAPRCANPGCHDGNFEPDFRTVQSAYSTLVYHPVVKKLKPWNYRVTPYDTAMSWLWQRINHKIIKSGTDVSEGQMPLYSIPLNQTQLDNISYWILHGAKDMFGQYPILPNTEPTISNNYYALNSSFTYFYSADREDSLFYKSFLVPANTIMNVVVEVADDSTPVANLTNNVLKISKKMNDFIVSQSYNGTYLYFPPPYDVSRWVFNVNTSSYAVGDTLYMRYYTNDGAHATDTEYPTDDLNPAYKSMWSFKIIP